MAVNLNADKQSEIWCGTIILTVAATIAVICRLIARRVSLAPFWWDDWILCISLLLNYAMNAIRWTEVIHWGYGRHAQAISASQLQSFWKSFLAVEIVYFANSCATKTSLLLLYYRLFYVEQKFRHALVATACIVYGYFIACTIVAICGCDPVSYFWRKNQPGRCVNETEFFRWNGIANLLIDVIILCLPMTMVWRLQLDLRQKLVLSGIFLLGGFVCAASIIRVVAFHEVNLTDPTYTMINTATWSSVEQSLGIVCACLPTLRPLFGHLFGGSKDDNGDTANGTAPRSGTFPLSRMSGSKSDRHDQENLVGFARLPEGVMPAPTYNGQQIGAAISTNAERGDTDMEDILGPARIMKTFEIHQTSDDKDLPIQHHY